MSTRAVINIMDEKNDPVLSIYHHWDGYPSNLGGKLHDFLARRVIGNGIGREAEYTPFSNGIGDLAAQLLVYLKKDIKPGAIYVLPLPKRMDSEEMARKTCNDCWGEYAYHIFDRKGKPGIEVWKGNGKEKAKLLYRGDPEGMSDFFEFGHDGIPVYEEMENASRDRAGAEWLVRNVPFARLALAADAYRESGADGAFMDFIESPANPVPELFEIQSQMLDFDNITYGDGPSLERITGAIEKWARFADPEKAPLAAWIQAECRIDPGRMGPEEEWMKAGGESGPERAKPSARQGM